MAALPIGPATSSSTWVSEWDVEVEQSARTQQPLCGRCGLELFTEGPPHTKYAAPPQGQGTLVGGL